jgi:hypothetical protein
VQDYVLKSDGTQELFDPSKLRASLERAGASTIISKEIVEEVSVWIVKPQTTNAIYKKAFAFLKKKKQKAPALLYSLRRSIAELGPTGFPFEKFVAQIFRKKGYTVENGRMVQGKCVDHEIDVLAWNDKDLMLAEVKFHSEIGAKSDLKVALYIDARFEDLKNAEVSGVAGDKRVMTHGLLITNTKFTLKAIQYGMCAGVGMIGWNFPTRGNLHDLITETKIHPVTCLPSLTVAEKKLIIDQGIVDCATFKNREDIYTLVPSLANKRHLIEADIRLLCEC